MNDADQFGFRIGVERSGELSEGERFAPRRLDGVDDGAAALEYIFHACTEHPVDADDNFITWLDQVDGAAFHTGHAGATDRECERVFRLHHFTEHRTGVVHDRQV